MLAWSLLCLMLLVSAAMPGLYGVMVGALGTADNGFGDLSLGHKGGCENNIDKRQPYDFGVGKRDPYDFGIGKRDPSDFGIGKRDPYDFGIGKRDP